MYLSGVDKLPLAIGLLKCIRLPYRNWLLWSNSIASSREDLFFHCFIERAYRCSRISSTFPYRYEPIRVLSGVAIQLPVFFVFYTQLGCS